MTIRDVTSKLGSFARMKDVARSISTRPDNPDTRGKSTPYLAKFLNNFMAHGCMKLNGLFAFADCGCLGNSQTDHDMGTVVWPRLRAYHHVQLYRQKPIVLDYEEPRQPTVLEKRIKRSIASLKLKKRGRYCRMHGWKNVGQHERSAFLVYDLKSNKEVVAINADQAMQAASMMKPFVALANYHAIARSELEMKDEEVHDALMELAMRYSDNVATTLLMRLLTDKGLWTRLIQKRKSIFRTLRWNRKSRSLRYTLPARMMGALKQESPQRVHDILSHYEIFHDTSIVEEIGPVGQTYKNRVSARDYSRFLQALWKRELPGSEKILRFMGMKNYTRLTDGSKLWEGIRVYDKTGTTGRLTGNMGILVDGKSAWIFVGIIENPAPQMKWARWGSASRRAHVIKHYSRWTYKWLKSGRNSGDMSRN